MPLLALLIACLLLPSPAAAGGDPGRGAALYDRCRACHSLARNRTGPKHCGLIGRPAGAVPGFAYSPAMSESGWIWMPETLDRFLAAPIETLPGTSMGYDGIKDPGERADLIAYLIEASRDPALCP
ncbi:MAG: c-type cytochrome [Pseudomonadota bacterium]